MLMSYTLETTVCIYSMYVCIYYNIYSSDACTMHMSEYVAVWVGERPKEKYGRGERKNWCTDGSAEVSFCSILLCMSGVTFSFSSSLSLSTLFYLFTFFLVTLWWYKNQVVELMGLNFTYSPNLLLLLHLHAADWSTVPADVQLGARGREGEEREGREEDRRNENLCFQSHGWFPSSSLEIISESGSQKTASLTNQNVPQDIQALQ